VAALVGVYLEISEFDVVDFAHSYDIRVFRLS
jgi:hypothetical protein